MKIFKAFNIKFYLSEVGQCFDIERNQTYKKYTFLNMNKNQIYSYHYYNNETYILSLKSINFISKDNIIKRHLLFGAAELKMSAHFYTYFKKNAKKLYDNKLSK